MLKQLFSFILLLILVVGVVFGLHVSILKESVPGIPLALVKLGYGFNMTFSLLVVFSTLLTCKYSKNQWGFVFIGSGTLKLAIFLILIKTSDQQIDKSLFLHFFIPYLVCVVLEIIYIARICNQANSS